MRAFTIGLALLLCAGRAPAAEPGPITGSLSLRHVSADAWEADYRFDEAVSAVDFGPAVVDFRRSAWTIRTPGLSLVVADGTESVRADGGAFRALRVRVQRYDDWSHDAYVPMDRHSDGGTAIYLGHFMGRVRQHDVERELRLKVRLEGLEGESTLLPDEAQRGLGVYAYFGPQAIVASGAMRELVDPATPAWIRAALADTARRVGAVYAARLGRSAPATMALIVGAADLEQPGYSIKGGALPGQIVYKLAGRDLEIETAEGRRQLQQLAAHELAHVWQGSVTRGGIGDTQPWVHEGGAEALSLLALQHSGLWSADETAAHAERLRGECDTSRAQREQDPGLPVAWREHYTCGFARFDDAGIDGFTLWTRLMARSEASGEPYSERMFEDVIARPAASTSPN